MSSDEHTTGGRAPGERAPVETREETWKQLLELSDPNLTSEQALNTYASWADTYDQDFSKLDYFSLNLISEALAKHVSAKDAKILDLAAGTGLLGEMITRKGYTNVDALDGTKAMLEKARSKNIYTNCICSFIGPNRLPINDDTYDAAITSGSFIPGHVNHECFPELIRIMKPGGHIFISMRASHLTKSPFFQGFEEAIQKYTQEGCWEVVDRQEGSLYMDDIQGILFHFKILNTKRQK